MSLIYFNFNGVSSSTEAIALIKEKTGLELIYVSGSGVFSCQVKFPDMENYVELRMIGINGGESKLCFVDVENHFFAYVSPATDMTYYNSSGLINDWLVILIHEKDGKLVSEMTGNSAMRMYGYCNITEYVDDIPKEKITLLPLYMSMSKSFVKNLYINYERCFTPGLKFIDQNGNRFMTLGSYLLYKID